MKDPPVTVDVEMAGPPIGTDKHVEAVEVDEVIAPETSGAQQTGLAEVRSPIFTSIQDCRWKGE